VSLSGTGCPAGLAPPRQTFVRRCQSGQPRRDAPRAFRGAMCGL